MSRKPDFIVIGAQKSASTFIQDCIIDHPEAYMLPGEIPFFENPDYLDSTIDDLFSRFSGKTEKVVGFKRPNYLAKPEVAPRLQEHLPDAKLIVILRHPIARAFSAFYHNINYGFLPLKSPEIVLKRIFEGKIIEGYPRASEILEFGLYCKYLKLYDEYKKKGNLLILIHDDIKENKIREIKKVYEYLNIDPSYIPSNLNSRPQAVVYNYKRLKFLRKKNKLIYKFENDNSRLKKKEGLIYKLIRYLFVSIDKVFLAKIWPNNKDELSDELMMLMKEIYEKDIVCLEKKFDLNLNAWKSDFK